MGWNGERRGNSARRETERADIFLVGGFEPIGEILVIGSDHPIVSVALKKRMYLEPASFVLVNEELHRSVTQCHQTQWVSPANINRKHHPTMREESPHSAPEISLENIEKLQSQVEVWPSKDQHWWICEGLRSRSLTTPKSTASLGTYMGLIWTH